MADINVGQISEALNDKTDRDFNNMNPSALSKETVVGWGMPDYTAGMAVSVPTSSTTYTAPSAGVYVLAYESPSSVAGKQILVNGNVAYQYQYTSAANPYFNCFILLNKGDVLSSDTNNTPSTIKFSIFYPMRGV